MNDEALQRLAELEVIAARSTLAAGDFKDREKAFRSLTPSLQALRRKQAKKQMSVRFAKKFAKLFKEGKIPNWVVEICDYETIVLLAGD
ncbi:MAG: hypothetical protein IM566_04205 [Pseudanabaena sp. M152S2SP2A07QC]|nr:hypothetical protein [Pseudanabaena sp. M109S1SP2A07QC]MCA6546626.1 hypothetical protein [Pseudanabaena sp. M152S2SP2A07QC]